MLILFFLTLVFWIISSEHRRIMKGKKINVNFCRLELDLDRLNPDYISLTDLNFENIKRLEVR
jgi:hypothetical protein